MLVLNSPQETRGGGSADGRALGSGTAIPTSLGATKYEINGLILNDRDSVDHYHVSKIDGLYDADVRDNREVRPDQHGETYYGGLYSGKPITIEGKIKARKYEKFLDMRMALTSAFDIVKSEVPLIGRTGDLDRDWQLFVAKTQALSLSDEIDSDYFDTDFMISLRASKPAIYSTKLETFSFPLTQGTTFKVINRGSEDAIPRMLVFGRQTGFFITNNSSNKTFALKSSTTIFAGDYLEVNFENFTITDSTGANRFSTFDQTSDWPLELVPEKEQTLTVGSTNRDASAAVTLFWRHTYK